MENLILNTTPSFEIKDDRFDTNQIGDCSLLIEISSEHFRFTVYNHVHQQFMWLEDYQTVSLLNENQLLYSLKKIYSEHLFLAANYWRRIQWSIHTAHFSLIPEELYRSDDAAKYLNFVSGKIITEKEQIMDYQHTIYQAYNVFGIDKELMNWFREMYPAKKIIPTSVLSAMMEGLGKEEKQNSMHIHFENSHVLVLVFKEGKLHFCNRIDYRTPQDLSYYILLIANEMGLDANISTILYGEVTTFSESYLLLTKLLNNMQFARKPKSLRFTQYFEEMPEHRYFTLFSLFHIS